jgi:RES domain
VASTWFRHGDNRYPFMWESASPGAARWHALGDGPVQYLADTPDGAWAEFLRHEEITDPADLAGIERALWAVTVDDEDETVEAAVLPPATLRGSLGSYPACQAEARRLRGTGATALSAPSAALLDGAARGQCTAGGLVEAADRDGRVLVLFGLRPRLRGWRCVAAGTLDARLLPLVRPL